MSPKIKNAIIFITIGIIMMSIYFFFIKKSPEEPGLVATTQNTTSTSGVAPVSSVGVPVEDSQLAKDFLSLLLSVKNINLDDSIFSTIAFNNLNDPNITLNPTGDEGRPNPFAPFGDDAATSNSSQVESLNSFKPTPDAIPVSNPNATPKP